MKKYLFLLLIIPALACSTSLTEPTAKLSADVSTETAIPSPTMTPTITATASPETCEVIAEALHLRDAPNVSGLVIAWLRQGDQLTLLPDPPAGDWRKVMTADKKIGWINSIYCYAVNFKNAR